MLVDEPQAITFPLCQRIDRVHDVRHNALRSLVSSKRRLCRYVYFDAWILSPRVVLAPLVAPLDSPLRRCA